MSNDLNLPWSCGYEGSGDFVIRDSGSYEIAYAGSEDDHMTGTSDKSEKIAAHIVKCANAHDGLVEALQSILDMCNEDSHARDYASRQTEIRGTAIVALRKAQGDQDGTR